MNSMKFFIIGLLSALTFALGCGDSSTGPNGDDETACTVQGTVQDTDGNGVAGAAVVLAGADSQGATVTKSTTTDSSGSYSFPDVPNGTYTVTITKDGYTCTPSTRPVTVSSADVTVSAFSAEIDSGGNGGGDGGAYSVSGQVTDTSGNAIPGVTVSTAVSDNLIQDTTDSNGNYTLSGLPEGMYVIGASKDGYVFAPEFQTVTISGVNVPNINFAGSSGEGGGGEGDNTVSGTVVDGTGTGISGITITLTGGASNLTTQTDSEGAFSFTGLADGTYTVIPSKDGYTFLPESKLTLVNNTDSTDNFFVGSTGSGGTNRVSGRVVDEYGAGIPDASMVMSRGFTDQMSTSTDENGYYVFEDFTDGNWVVVADHDDYAFEKPTKNATVSNGQIVLSDFVGSYTGYTYDIIGTVEDSWGDPLEGVTVIAARGSFEVTVTTDTDGEYRFEDMPAFTYEIRASLTGYTFTPDPYTVVYNESDEYDIDFTGSSGDGYHVSGVVTGSESDSYSGVEITLVSDAYTLSGTTGADGSYSVLAPNGTYVVTPVKGNYAFTPETQEITVSGQDVTLESFASENAGPFTISGRVVDTGGNGYPGGLYLYKEGTDTPITAASCDKDGYYTFKSDLITNGTYTVVPPEIEEISFEPESIVCTVDGADITVEDIVYTILVTE